MRSSSVRPIGGNPEATASRTLGVVPHDQDEDWTARELPLDAASREARRRSGIDECAGGACFNGPHQMTIGVALDPRQEVLSNGPRIERQHSERSTSGCLPASAQRRGRSAHASARPRTAVGGGEHGTGGVGSTA